MSMIEASVINKLITRSVDGARKYGTTMERADLHRIDWLNHAQQEALDLAVYLEKLIQLEKAREVD